MLIVSYDIENDRLRTKFSKFLKMYGRRLQYSVYELKNSSRVLNNVIKEIELSFKKQFQSTDSVVIFTTCEACKKKIVRYGHAVHEEKGVVIFS